MKSILQKLPLGLQQSAVVVFGNNLSYLLSAISLLLITRILGPVQFGIFSVGFAVLLMLVRINDMGTTFVIQRYAAQASSNTDANKIFSLTLKIKLIVSIIIICLGILLSDTLSVALRFEHPVIIGLAFYLTPLTMLYEHLQAMLQSVHRFTQSVVANILQASSKVLGALVLFFVEYRFTLTAAPTTLVTALTMITFSFYVAAPAVPVFLYKKLLPRWVQISLLKDFTKQKKLITKLAAHSAVGFISVGIIENIDILFAQSYTTSYEVGLLSGVTRVALIFNLAAASLGTVLNPRVAKYSLHSDIKEYLKKAWLVAAACVFGGAMLIPFSYLLIFYTIGPDYLAGSFILNLLLISAFLTIAVVPFSALFFTFDAPWYFSLTGVLQVLIIVVGNWLLVPQFGIEATAWVRLAARAILFLCTVFAAYYLYMAHTSRPSHSTHP